MTDVKVIGGGLAGSEAAVYLADKGFKVSLYDIKPNSFTPAHKNAGFAELVCSNSLKSGDHRFNACGLLKEEMRRLGSVTMAAADISRVPAGAALAVDRDSFSEIITERIVKNPNITVISEEVRDFDTEQPIIICTGPLTTDSLADYLGKLTSGSLYFFDAAAPIVSGESIDMEKAFFGARYGKGGDDYLNCPLDKEEYEALIENLVSAESAGWKDFEKKVFEGCMPVEAMAKRGKDTLRFGPLKPVGLTDPKTGKKSYACLQLRREKAGNEMFNLVGFQTNLTFPEQKRVFSMIPALKNAVYLKYGVMHKNIYIDSPKHLSKDNSLKGYKNVFLAGQLTGVEGYVESAASGMLAGINMARRLEGKEPVVFPRETILGALSHYITEENENFQPMNANYGILPPLDVRDKRLRRERIAERSLELIDGIITNITY